VVLKLRADGAGVAIFAYASTIPEDQQHYELGVAFKNNEDYKNAILELSKIEASSTYYEEAQKIVDIAKESYVNAVLNEVKQCNSVEDFEKSFQKMYEAEEILELLTDISLELAETEELYRTSLLKKAEVTFETDGWEEAISVLEEGFEWLPDDSLIESEIRKYEEYAPVYIYNMPIFEGDDWTIYDSVEDNLGNTYNNAVSSSYFKDETRTYKMNGEYKRIKGTLFVRKEERNTDWGTLLQIIGDGNLLYSAQVSGGDEPISFNVDISNIEEFSIFYTWMASATYTSGFTAIGDFAVYKN
jgi:tetratricopeptide (TPR) repeat protein